MNILSIAKYCISCKYLKMKHHALDLWTVTVSLTGEFILSLSELFTTSYIIISVIIRRPGFLDFSPKILTKQPVYQLMEIQ